MILADTSIWVDFLRAPSLSPLGDMLADEMITMHPLVAGEIAVGSLHDRSAVLSLLADLPPVERASDFLVMHLIESHRLFGRGLGYIDAHLLASARLTPETQLWTRDKALAAAAAQLAVAFEP